MNWVTIVWLVVGPVFIGHLTAFGEISSQWNFRFGDITGAAW